MIRARIVPNASCLSIFPIAPGIRTAQDLAAALRRGNPAILGRIVDDGVLFDVRTMSDEDVELVAERVRELAALPA